MILRFSYLLGFLFLFAKAADDSPTFDCHVTIKDFSYDLTKLKGEQTIERTRNLPPSTMHDGLRFNLCEDLTKLDGVDDADQCPSGTRACLTTTNQKPDQKDRVVFVIPVAKTSDLKPEYSPLNVSESEKGLSLTLHGPSYPSMKGDNTTVPQSIQLNILCTSDQDASKPTFISYDGAQARVEWKQPSGCAFKAGGDLPPGGDKDKDDGGGTAPERVGSGIGWFFLVILVAFAAYFVLGAYYNYTTYGARGMDLIPHRDFWQEVPYMIQDVASHLCSTVRSRRPTNRGGYIAV